MNGDRVLAHVIRTQTALAEPDFDLDTILRGVADEARALTGAEAAVVETPDGAVITSSTRRRYRRPPRSSIVVALPDGGDGGALKVYSSGRKVFGSDDRRTLELLAGLVWSAVTRAALPPHARRPPAP